MRHRGLIVFLTLLSLTSPPLMAEENVLPPLPTAGFVYGRIATKQDVTEGNAAFATPSDQDSRREPIDIPVPQYAVYLGDGANKLVFVSIARVYREAGDWERAKALFERSLRENPDDSKGMAELGSYYLMRGDRGAAEALFDRSFKLESDDVWSTIAAAGSYLGVPPQE